MYRSSSSTFRTPFVPVDSLASSPDPQSPTVIDWNDNSDFDDSGSSDVSFLEATQPTTNPSRSIPPSPHSTVRNGVPLLTRTMFDPESTTSLSIRTPSPAPPTPARAVKPLFVRNSWGNEMSSSDVASVLGIRAVQDVQQESPKETRATHDLQQLLSQTSFTPPTQTTTSPRQEFGCLVERMQGVSISASTMSPPPTPSPEPPAYMEDSIVLTERPATATNSPSPRSTPPRPQEQQPRASRQTALPNWFMDRYVTPRAVHTTNFSPTPYPVGVPPRPPSDNTSYLSYTRPSPSPYQGNPNDRAPPSREMSPRMSRPISSASSQSSGLFATPRAPSRSPRTNTTRFGGRSTTSYPTPIVRQHEPYLPPPGFGLFEGSTISTTSARTRSPSPSPSWPSQMFGPPCVIAPSSRTDETPRGPPASRSFPVRDTPSPPMAIPPATPSFTKRARFANNHHYRSPERFPPAGGSGLPQSVDSAQPHVHQHGHGSTSGPPHWDGSIPSNSFATPTQPAQRGVPPPTSSMWEHNAPYPSTYTPGACRFTPTPRANPNANGRYPLPSETPSRPGFDATRPHYYPTPVPPVMAPPLSTPSWYLPHLSWGPPSMALPPASQMWQAPPSLPTAPPIPGATRTPLWANWAHDAASTTASWQQPVNTPTPWQQQPANPSTPWVQPVNASAPWQQPATASAPWQPATTAAPWQQPVNATPWLGSTPRRRGLPPRPSLLNYHPRFAFPDGTVLFKVEDVAYKVHRYFFDQHSSFFQTLLQSYPPYSGAATVDPIFLQDVSRTDFERLLSVFYPTNFYEPDLKTVEEWTSVLSLSTKWVFTQLRLRAIKELESLAGPTDRILIARKHTIKEWFVPAYKELCIRRQAMSLEDGQKLGLETVIKVWDLQQEFECREECCEEMHVAKVKERFGLE